MPILRKCSRKVSTCAVLNGCPGKMLPEKPEQAVGKGMQQQAELIGEKAMATQPVRRKTVLQLLDPILHLAAMGIDAVIQHLGIARQVGDHKPPIGSLHHALCLGKYPPLPAP